MSDTHQAAKRDRQTEADTYNHLCNFFSRYDDEGDFMSLRRYKGQGKEPAEFPLPDKTSELTDGQAVASEQTRRY